MAQPEIKLLEPIMTRLAPSLLNPLNFIEVHGKLPNHVEQLIPFRLICNTHIKISCGTRAQSQNRDLVGQCCLTNHPDFAQHRS